MSQQQQQQWQSLLLKRQFCSNSTNNFWRRQPILIEREHFVPGRQCRKPLDRNELSRYANKQSSSPATPEDCATLVILVRQQIPRAIQRQMLSSSSGDANAETALLFTHRARRMRKHANEISMPGGHIHPGETLEQCALRETEEEIGLPRQHLQIWGTLRPLVLHGGGTATPVVASFIGDSSTLLARPGLLRPQRDEVQAIFTVPIRELIASVRHTVFRVPNRQKDGMPLFYKMPVFVVNEFRMHYPTTTTNDNNTMEEEAEAAKNSARLPPPPPLPKQHTIWGLTALTVRETLLALVPEQQQLCGTKLLD